MRWALLLLICASATAETLTVPATVEAFEQTDLYPRATGYVSAVNVDIGDVIKAGQVLAVIDAPDLEKELIEAKATLAARQRGVQAAAAAVKQARMAVAVAKHQIDRYKADADYQNVTLKRQQELFAGKAITDQQADEARNKAALAEADLGVAQSKAAAAEADLAGAQASEGVATAQVAVADAAAARIATMLQFTKITAPYDGVVTRRWVNRGDLEMAAGAAHATPLFTVQRVDTVRVFCDVPEGEAANIAVAAAASVKLYGPSEAIKAKVTRLAGALNPQTRTLRVEIDLPNPNGKLLPGSYAQVTFTPSPTK